MRKRPVFSSNRWYNQFSSLDQILGSSPAPPLRSLGIFHNWVAHLIAVRQPRWQPYGIWVYPPIGEALEEAGLWPVEAYISQR